MKKNDHFIEGYVLIEVLISMMLSFFVISYAISLLAATSLDFTQTIAKKELLESADRVEYVFTNEFSKSKEIKDLLDINGNEITELEKDKTVRFKCIGLVKSKYNFYKSGYVEEFIYGGKTFNYTKKPIYIAKIYSLDCSAKDYKHFSGFEAGDNVDNMNIRKIDDYSYIIDITLAYKDTDINYKKSFLVELNRG
ncbi:MAG: hypothetical protein ACRC76_07090 [Proteocatella sp.]